MLRVAWFLTGTPAGEGDYALAACWSVALPSSALVQPGAASRDDNDHAADDLDHIAVRCCEDREAEQGLRGYRRVAATESTVAHRTLQAAAATNAGHSRALG